MWCLSGPLKETGKKVNLDLGQEFGLTKKKDFPAYKLYVSGREGPIDYDGDIKADDIKMFVSKHSGSNTAINLHYILYTNDLHTVYLNEKFIDFQCRCGDFVNFV